MIYFKVYQDYTKFVPIDETEYEKALYAFIKGKPAIFEMGAVSRIESIIPDLNKINGWYSDYKPTADDNAELEQAKRKAQPYMARIKERVQYLIENKKENLIGKNVEIPELEKPQNPQLQEATKQLADKFKV